MSPNELKMNVYLSKIFVMSVQVLMAAGSLLVAVERDPGVAAPEADEGAAAYAEGKSVSVSPPLQDRIVDDAGIFSSGEGEGRAEQLRRDLDQLYLETGCQVYVATVAEGKGNSAKKAAEKLMAEWMPAAAPGAVLVYDRQSNSFGVSATDGALAVIPAFLFALMEQTATSARADGGAHDLVSLAVGDLEALFQKHFNNDAKKDHPALRADMILFAAVSGAIVLMVAAVAFLSWRHQRRNLGI